MHRHTDEGQCEFHAAGDAHCNWKNRQVELSVVTGTLLPVWKEILIAAKTSGREVEAVARLLEPVAEDTCNYDDLLGGGAAVEVDSDDEGGRGKGKRKPYSKNRRRSDTFGRAPPRSRASVLACVQDLPVPVRVLYLHGYSGCRGGVPVQGQLAQGSL